MGLFKNLFYEDDEPNDKKQGKPAEDAGPIIKKTNIEFGQGFDGTPSEEDVEKVCEFTDKNMTGVVKSFMNALNSLTGVIADEKQRFAAAFATSFSAKPEVTKEALVSALNELAETIPQAVELYEAEWRDYTHDIINAHVHEAERNAEEIELKNDRISDLKEEIAELKRQITEHETNKIDSEAEAAKAQGVLISKQESVAAAIEESKEGITSIVGKVEAFI